RAFAPTPNRASAWGWASRLVGGDVRGARDAREKRDVAAHDAVEFFRRGRARFDADGRPACTRFPIGEDLADGGAEPRFYLRGKAGWAKQAEPEHRVVALHAGLVECRHLGKKRIALERRNAEAKKAALLHVVHRVGDRRH